LPGLLLVLGASCSLDTERFSFDGAGGSGGVGSGAAGGGGSGADGTGASGTGASGGGGGAAGCEPGTMVSCYTGDPMTADVGECASGMTLCTDEGVPGDTCDGEALPTPESCTDPLDEDCDGFSCSETLWADVAGDIDEQNASDIAVDQNTGAVYVVGSFKSSITFGADTLVADSRDGFLVKYDADGNVVWTQQFPGPLSQFLGNVAVDTQGDVIVSGGRSSTGSLDFGLGPVGENFFAKFDADGNAIWFVDCDLPNGSIGDLKVDTNDDAIVLGATFQGSGQCGSELFNSNSGSRDIILSKFSSTKVNIWDDLYGGPSSDGLGELGIDGSGFIIMVGEFRDSIVLGNINLQSPANDNVFVVRFDTNGTKTWHKNYGDAANQTVEAVAVSSAGGVVLGGRLAGTITASGGPQLTTGDMYVIALAASGTHIWSKSWDNPGLFPFRDLGISPNNDIHVTGVFNNVFSIGGPDLGGNNGTGFIARLEADTGAHVWSRSVGDLAKFDFLDVIKVAMGPAGEVHLAGNAEGSITLTNPALATMGQDVFVAKIAP